MKKHIGTMVWACVASLPAACCLAADASVLPLAEDSQTQYVISLAADASAPEKTAATELAAYLRKITGAEFKIVTPEKASGRAVIAVGPGAAAPRLDQKAGVLDAEEWIVRSSGRDLLLVGGRPRGTLYAVYHFLEDVLDVPRRDPGDETVPRQPTLRPRAQPPGPADLPLS